MLFSIFSKTTDNEAVHIKVILGPDGWVSFVARTQEEPLLDTGQMVHRELIVHDGHHNVVDFVRRTSDQDNGIAIQATNCPSWVWLMKQELRTPKRTTCWDEMFVVMDCEPIRAICRQPVTGEWPVWSGVSCCHQQARYLRFTADSSVPEAGHGGRTELTFTDVDANEGAVIRPDSHRSLTTEGKQHKLRHPRYLL